MNPIKLIKEWPQTDGLPSWVGDTQQNSEFTIYICRYRNEELLTDGGRIRTTKSEEGIYTLTILSTKPHDFGVYKAVARNKLGKVTCRARLMLGGELNNKFVMFMLTSCPPTCKAS